MAYMYGRYQRLWQPEAIIMYLPDLSGIVSLQSVITTPTPLDTSHFALGISGVLGLLGGDEAISAVATVLVHKGGRWLGWYNSPGSYHIAKKYGLAATSTVFRGLFPGVRTNATKVFELDGWQGPRFQAIRSGTVLGSTGHLSSILMKECASLTSSGGVARRHGSGTTVSIVTLNSVPFEEVSLPRFSTWSLFFAIFPIATSVAACAATAFLEDWFALSAILLGILSNGIFCLVIGSGKICFTHHSPAPGSPPGDGIFDVEKDFVLLQGDEGAVNSVTRGRLSLRFCNSGEEYIGCCSILFIIQFIAQLLLMALASLPGQILFIITLAVSAVYNAMLASFDKEKIQRRILLERILQPREKPSKFTFDARTSAVVFILCVLHDQLVEASNRIRSPPSHATIDGQDGDLFPNIGGFTLSVDPAVTSYDSPAATATTSSALPSAIDTTASHFPISTAPTSPQPDSPSGDFHTIASKILDTYLPNDTRVWNLWKGTLLRLLCTATADLDSENEDWGVSEFDADDRQGILLETFKKDALAAYDFYKDPNSPIPN